MAKRNLRTMRGLLSWFLALSQLGFVAGCRSDGYSSSGGSSGQVSAAATAGPNLGAIIYDMLHQTLQKKGSPEQLAAFEKDKQDFIDAVNRVLPTDVSSNLWPTAQKLFALIDDDTLPKGMADMEAMLKDLLADKNTCAALSGLMGMRPSSALDPRDVVRLLSRILAYPELDTLATATGNLVNEQPDLVRNVFALVSRKLKGMTAESFQGNGLGLNGLASALLAPADTTGLGDLGAPAWAVHLDKNSNPKVNVDPTTGKVVAPFVDDGTGCAQVDADGKPIDAQGQVITLRPFGSDGSRDSDGRALADNGGPVFDYFDAKRTLLGVSLVLTGNLLKLNVPGDLVSVLDKSVARVSHADANDPWSGFGPDDPFIDLAYAQMELVRRTPVPQLLEGLSTLVKNDPVGFEQMVTSLVVGVNLAKQSGFSTAGQQ
ncbi:hypothetical protein HY251_11305 [bacterium]|nr:hypothetical protein [bacterium]